eukprot:CAMPEP_0118924716 /NCGR_PEP_ID=MMETSP1169-20130426/2725_1 /TAXON_ID=36882 /ORGANISM="Pyramimonas obovata, Strain CCMP722" /LENGTH=355 /DNA_ID=CAMNT_0006865847 /DNA_START=568 /DNA_END=1632 /DNA_ORIENTATION=-
MDDHAEDPELPEEELPEEEPELEEEKLEEDPELPDETLAADADGDSAAPMEEAKADGGENKEEPAAEEPEEDVDPLKGTEDDEVLKKPPHSSEIFLGGIPRSLTKEELEELCQEHGDVFEIRLLKDVTTGQNRGYAFVVFKTREAAAKAIEKLNGSEIKGKKGVRVTLSESKFRLFVGNLPRAMTHAEVLEMLKKQEPGVEALELPSELNAARNRGYAFVDLYNSAAAERARKTLTRPGFKVKENVLTVRWAEPRNEIPQADLAKVKSIYVRGVPATITEANLKELFAEHGEIEKAVLPSARPGGVVRDFAFVHFKERESAVAAVKVEKVEFEGKTLEVSMAKPQPKREHEGQQG